MTTILRGFITKLRQIAFPTNTLNYFNNLGATSKFCQHSPVTEQEITTILKKKYPEATNITVEDVSGGCGAMFNIFIETKDFKGLSVVKQHRSVYDTLKEQIKNIHGLHVETRVPN
ncbi:bolA-like protein 3 [Aethina tumida]|uniref:bolA-like protein 3 n=1 Tax=Aethina tumida TaxID=116153 RepID=UPI00096AE00C|nr:bolA-like protein 3 [Aethina tumida]